MHLSLKTVIPKNPHLLSRSTIRVFVISLHYPNYNMFLQKLGYTTKDTPEGLFL